MAIVGDAHVLVRAITDKVRPDIDKAFSSLGPVYAKHGENHAQDYSKGFSKGTNGIGDHIDSALGGINVSGHGNNAGGDWSDGFMGSLGNGIDLSAVLNNVNSSGIGHTHGTNFGTGFSTGAGNLGNTLGDAMTAAGSAGGRGMANGLKVSGFDPAAKAAADSFTILWSAGNVLGTGLAGLVGGISSVVSGLYAMGAAAAQSIGALAALPGVLSGAIQGFAAFKIGFSGISAAIKNGLKAQVTASTGSSKAANSAADAIESAQKGITDALRTTTRTVTDAKTALQRAYSDAADAAATAAERVSDAEQDVADAQREVLRAQLDVTQAREAGIESLQQLGFSAEGAALAEQRAALKLQDAHAKLLEIQETDVSDKTRVETELSFKEAELSYRRAKDNAADLKTAQEAAATAGVDGTSEVVSAQEKLNDATDRQLSAEEKLVDAKIEQQKSLITSSERVADAQERIARAEEDGALRAADAQEALADAYKASAAAVSETSSAQDAFTNSLKDLSPQARSFVQYIISIQDEMLALKQAVGTDMFPKLQQAIAPIVSTVFPLLAVRLRETGGILGDLAVDFSDMITSAEGIRDLDGALTTNNTNLGLMSEGFTSLVQLALRFVEATGPLTQRFLEWVNGMIDAKNEALGTADGMEQATTWFNNAGDAAAKLGDIFGGLWEMLKTLGRGSNEAGNSLLDSFQAAIDSMNTFLATAEGDGSLQIFFTNAADNLKIIGGFVGDVLKGFLLLGGDPRVGAFFSQLREAGEPFGGLVESLMNALPLLGDLIIQGAHALEIFADSQAAETFFKTLTGSIKVIVDLLSGGVGQSLLLILGPMFGILKAFKLLGIGAQFFGLVMKGNLQTIKGVATKVTGLGSKSLFGAGAGTAAAAPATAALASTAVKVPVTPVAAPGAQKGLGKIFSGLSKGLGTFGKIGGAIFKGLGAALRLLTGPIGMIALIAIPLLISGFKHLYANNEGFKAFVDGMLAMLQKFVDWLTTVFMAVFDSVGGFLQDFGADLAEAFSPLITYLVDEFWPMLQEVFGQIVDALKPFVDTLINDVWPVVQKVFGAIVDFVIKYVIPVLVDSLGFQLKVLVGVIKFLASVIATVLTVAFKFLGWAIKNVLVPLFVNVLIPVFKKAGEYAGIIFGAMVDAFKIMVDGFVWAWNNIGKPVIDGLVNAFIWARDGIKSAVDGIGDAWSWVIEGLSTTWSTYGQPVIDWVVGAFTSGRDGVTGAVTGINDAWNWVVNGLSTVWYTYGQPIIDAVVATFDILSTTLTTIFNELQAGWDFLVNGFSTTWSTAGKVFTDTVTLAFNTLWRGVQIVFNWLKAGWLILLRGIQTVWAGTGKPAIDGVVLGFTWLRDKLTGIMDNVHSRWDTTMNVLRTVWNSTGKPLVDGIVDAFESMGDTISAVWTAMKDAPASGLRGLINNLNNWLVKPLNKLTGMFGLTIPDIPMPQGLATGGRVYGPGGEREDKVPILGSPNEYMINAKSSRSLGYDTLDYINRTGSLPATTTIAVKKESGGLFDLAKDGIAKVASSILGGFSDFLPKGDDLVSKLVRSIFDKLKDQVSLWGSNQDAIAAEAAAGGSGSLDASSIVAPKAGKYGGTNFAGEQLTNAAVIARVAAKFGVGTRGAQIGLMTAMQESGLRNISYGDRDSLGLFQQRGSWGSAAQRTTPEWAATAFYKALVKVKSWESLGLGQAAQRVQISAYPDAYNKWSDEASALLKTMNTVTVAAGQLGIGSLGSNEKVPRVSNPDGLVTWKGGKFTRQFASVLQMGERIAGVPIQLNKGGFQPDGGSSGTSHRADAVDMSVNMLLLRALRSLGVAIWDRTGMGNWKAHMHGVPAYRTIGKAAGSALWQASAYLKGYNGLHGTSTVKAGPRIPFRGMKLASGGVVQATEGGVMAMIGEAGKNERVEPLDRSGLSRRDRAMIELLSGGGSGGDMTVRVYIGDRELTDIVNVVVEKKDRDTATSVRNGRKRL